MNKTNQTINELHHKYQAPDYTKYKWFGKFAGIDRTKRVYQTNGTIPPKLHLAIHEKLKEGWINE